MKILIQFDGEVVTWASCGWGDNRSKLVAAQKAINKGETPEQVIELLEKAGFEVIVEKDV